VFFSLRREISQYPSVPGTETYVTFVDSRRPHGPRLAATVGGVAWCTNRRAAERLSPGVELQASPGVAVRGGTLATRPSRHGTPKLLGEPLRRLCAQLSHQTLPLWGGVDALSRFKHVLREHGEHGNALARQQIDGLVGVAHARVAERTGREAWHGLTTGVELTFSVDLGQFADSSAQLFGQVLTECLAEFAPLNSFVRVRLMDTEGNLLRESPLRTRGHWRS
jgi:type VI secretion system protein ImpG